MVQREMNSERWQQIDEIFAQATSLAESERQAFLESSCRGDPELHADLNELLRAHGSEGALDRMEGRLADAVGAALPTGLEAGTLVGDFHIRQVLGRGGMGVVYLGDREVDGVRQVVAIKVLRQGLQSADSTRRFLGERRILARLDHPNIPRFLDGGLTASGAPYFAMEYVEGTPLTTYCNERKLPVRRRLELFVVVCDAVQYAHSHLVVHRDLKPTNILVTPDGVVKVLDFGIAKLLDAEQDGETGAGVRWMTLDYASPEQINGGAVTTAVDVFTLGVVLYELLCGRRPHTGSRRHSIERAILETDPVAPSATGIAAGVPDHEFPDGCDGRELIGDVDLIALRALNKAPEQRYGTAGALAEDIRRHLSGLPVSVRPDTLAYRARKFITRRLGLDKA
jgi:eukaryotic-like serine/threonine-protein kinase